MVHGWNAQVCPVTYGAINMRDQNGSKNFVLPIKIKIKKLNSVLHFENSES